tara:strand:- start:667 stop:1926 length:1260 start_codon:yes stop_codon:yes gene_type:complete
MNLSIGKTILKMRINKLIRKKNKGIPSFCSSNFDVLKSILIFCDMYKLPCLIECTSNQVNQNGGYTGQTPSKFFRKVSSLSKKINFNKKNLFLGGDHLGTLPWRKSKSSVAMRNAHNLINSFLRCNFCKIHIDTSIKCEDDRTINNDIIFDRTYKILNHPKIKKKIRNRFLIIGTEVPLSGSGDNARNKKTSLNQIENEIYKFKKILKKLKLKHNIFGLVIEPGMKYMHNTIKKPNLNNFSEKKKFSMKNSFIYEAHSTDYQSLKTLKSLVKNNFKFLKVGPELTYEYSKSLFLMERIEKFFFKNKYSQIKKKIFESMVRKNLYWKDYYSKNNRYLFLNSKLDRMRYYFNNKNIRRSLRILEKNINNINEEKIYKKVPLDSKKIFKFYRLKKLNNFESLKLIFLTKTLKKYFYASGYKF